MSSDPVLNLNGDVPVQMVALDVPPLEDVAAAFQKKLCVNFSEVKTEVVCCPNLTLEPFNLASEGLGGNPTIIEIGGPAYLLPLVQRHKIYDLRGIPDLVGDSCSFIVGAGAGPWPYAGVNCELVMNKVLNKDTVLVQGSRLAKLVNDNKVHLETLPADEARCCLLANIFSSRGESGNVIKVHCKKRIGELDITTSLRLALAEAFPNLVIGIGGVILLAQGKAKQHVMPDFSKDPLKSDEDVNRWLKFFDMSAPLIAVGTFVSMEPGGLDLRLQHFHSFGKTEGGHYHIDTTPEDVEYLAYLACGSTLYRVDKPPKSSGYGFD